MTPSAIISEAAGSMFAPSSQNAAAPLADIFNALVHVVILSDRTQ